jgi:hypothetical protein
MILKLFLSSGNPSLKKESEVLDMWVPKVKSVQMEALLCSMSKEAAIHFTEWSGNTP